MPKKRTNNWKKHAKKEFVIVAYSPEDEYELPIKLYLTFQEMADDLHIAIKRVYDLVEHGYVFRQTNLKYLKVRCY
jgi:hypothetical protein